MKILVPVDGSLASENAVKKAMEIAEKGKHVIKIVTVVKHDDSQAVRRNEKLWRQVDGSIITGRAINVSDEEMENRIKQGATEILESITKKIDFHDVLVEKEILFGEPHEKIVELASKDKIDLIIMGSRGFSKIKRFFVGSVTQKVISEATCPVLVVHEEAMKS
jgi:nucleotide-binding universal stress UspA family protein